jgi:hypothetical protein
MIIFMLMCYGCDRAGQLGKMGSLRRKGQGE